MTKKQPHYQFIVKVYHRGLAYIIFTIILIKYYGVSQLKGTEQKLCSLNYNDIFEEQFDLLITSMSYNKALIHIEIKLLIKLLFFLKSYEYNNYGYNK